MAEDAIDKEKKIKDTEKLYMNLREILSKQPGPQVTVALSKTQKALRERGQKMKVEYTYIFFLLYIYIYIYLTY